MHNHPLPLTIDLTSLTIIAGWWAGVVPSVATTLTAAWIVYCFAKEIYHYIKRKNK